MSIPLYPPKISTCILWLDASDPTTLTTSSDRVISWLDKSGYAHNTNTVSAQGPFLSNLNNLSSLFFQANAGTAQFFQGPISTFSSLSVFPLTSYYLTTFAVGTISTTSVPGYFPNFVGAGFQRNFYPGSELVQWSTTQANIAVFPSATLDSNVYDIPSYNQTFLVGNSCTYDGTSVYSYLNVNGYPQTRCDYPLLSPTSTIGAYAIGGNFAASTDFRDSWTGHIAEILMYATSNVIPWNERQLIEGYLTSKWGIQSSLPFNHPYRFTPTTINTTTSALYISNSNTSRNVVLPSTNTISSQLLWAVPNNQLNQFSSVSLLGSSTDLLDTEPSITLNENYQSALLANNPETKSWLVHSLATNNPVDTCTVSFTPYIQYPRGLFQAGTNSPGDSIAISADGNIVIVGDQEYDGPAANSGGISVFLRNTTSDLYSTFQVALVPNTAQINANLGGTVAISDDGKYIAGGASNFNQTTFSDAGAVYVYTKSASTDFWSFSQRLDPPVGDQKTQLYFGCSLTMSSNGDYIFVGANANPSGVVNGGVVYPFKKIAETDSWTALPTIVPPVTVTSGANFGGAISITGDAGYLLISASNYDFSGYDAYSRAGSVFFYKKNSGTDQWDFLQQIVPSDIIRLQYFGRSVGLSRNSNYFVASTYLASHAYIYKKSANTDFWNFSYIISGCNVPVRVNRFGDSCSISEDATYILIGTTGSSPANILGTAVMYQKSTNSDIWQLRNLFYGSDSSQSYTFAAFSAMTPSGSHVALTNETTTAANKGVYIYKQSTFTARAASNSFNLIDTTLPTRPLLLPHPSTNPYQMIYIKDAKNKALVNPVFISTTNNSFINNSFNNFVFLNNNGCVQLQSDGVSSYTFVNYFTGAGGIQTPAYNFRSFWVQGTTRGAQSNYPFSLGVNRNDTTIFPAGNGVLSENIFFRDSDNQTRLPHWIESNDLSSDSNLFWIKTSYIPPWPMSRQFFMYWNCNTIYSQDPNEIFSLYDDFNGTSNDPPDSNKWFVVKKGSDSATVALTGFSDTLVLRGVNTTLANGGILTKIPYLSTNFSINFFATIGASRFATVAFGQTSTLQFMTTGGQTDWNWTTLGNGYTLAFSTTTRRFLYEQAENAAPITLGCNTTTWSLSTRFNYELTYQDNGQIILYSNSAARVKSALFTFTDTTYLNSNKYLFFGQGSSNTEAAAASVYNLVILRKFVNPEPAFENWGGLNTLY